MKDLSMMGDFAAEAIEHDAVSFVAWFSDGRLHTANSAFYRLTGYTEEEAKDMKWPGDFASKDLTGSIVRGMAEAGRDHESHCCEGCMVRKDRSQVPVSIYLHMYPGPEPLFYAFIMDISHLKAQEKWLQITQFAMDHFTDPSLWVDADGRIVYVNEAASREMGYMRDELLSMRVWQIDRLESPENFLKRWAYAKAAGHIRFEALNVREDGKQFLTEVHASYIRFDDTERLICFAHDITDRRRAEEALAESEEKFRVLTDTSLAAIFLIQEGRFIYVNPVASRILMCSNDELMHMHFWDIVHPEFREEVKAYATDVRSGRQVPDRFEIKFVKKDRSVGWCDVTLAPIRYRGKPASVVTAMDITERKHAELALAESEEKFRVLTELSPTAIFLYQSDKLIYANPAAVGFTGYSMGELLSKKFWDMVHPEFRELVRSYGLARQQGEPVPATYEVKYITKSGGERWAQFTAGRIEYKGMPAGVVTAIDNTERKLADIELREAKRQADLYIDLMGHDINNMNQAALGFLEIVSERMALRQPTGMEEIELVANAMDALSRSTELIGTVRKLQKERSGGLKTEVIDVQRVLEEVRKQHASVPGRDIIITFLPSCRCRVLANELLKDVFSNIVGNAIKHSSGDIAIGILLDRTEEQGRIYCRVAVEDTGPGIPDERKRAIFERAGKAGTRLTGKGLGLYLVKTLVDDYHGRVWVEDRVPGDYRKGTRLVVILPVAPGAGEDAAEGADASIG